MRGGTHQRFVAAQQQLVRDGSGNGPMRQKRMRREGYPKGFGVVVVVRCEVGKGLHG